MRGYFRERKPRNWAHPSPIHLIQIARRNLKSYPGEDQIRDCTMRGYEYASESLRRVALDKYLK
jgi:hypothetical protein